MRLTNPTGIDDGKLAEQIEAGRDPVLQFDRTGAYPRPILERVNQCCERFGDKVHVRFYGHYSNGNRFDCLAVRQIPAVRSLGIDCLLHVENIDVVDELEHLKTFRFGVYESDLPDLLRFQSLRSLRKLIVGETRKRNIDLAPIAGFERLEEFTTCGQDHDLNVLGAHAKIRRLALNMIPSKRDIGFISKMPQLRFLQILLGGRTDMGSVRHRELRDLRILRVRGFSELDLSRFPALDELHVEDQLRLIRLDLTPVVESLRTLRISNCKKLEALKGLAHMKQPSTVRLGGTSLDAEWVMTNLPKNAKEVSLFGYGLKRDQRIKEKLAARGCARLNQTTRSLRSEFGADGG